MNPGIERMQQKLSNARLLSAQASFDWHVTRRVSPEEMMAQACHQIACEYAEQMRKITRVNRQFAPRHWPESDNLQTVYEGRVYIMSEEEFQDFGSALDTAVRYEDSSLRADIMCRGIDL